MSLRNLYDHYSKAILAIVLEQVGRAERQRELRDIGQYIDVAFDRDERALSATQLRLLGRLGRMAARGQRALFESFHQTPGAMEIEGCIRKQHNYFHQCVLDAQQRDELLPEKPILWILSPGRPSTALKGYDARRMPRWPKGFWQRALLDAVFILCIRDLPRTRDTLSLRLLGRGQTFIDAVHDLFALPRGAFERELLGPPVLAFLRRLGQTPDAMAEHLMFDDQYSVDPRQAAEELRAEGLQMLREAHEKGERAILLRLLKSRFGALSEASLQRIDSATALELELWSERILTAHSLDEVFA